MSGRWGHITVIALLAAAVAISAYFLMPAGEEMLVTGLPDNFNVLSRQEQVMVCAGCHPSQYRDEMEGPHANAYLKLQQHFAEVHEADYPYGFYTDFLGKIGQDGCLGCHATENLFGSWFTGYDDTVRLGVHNPDGSKKFAVGRKDPGSFSTGVDCITCHYDGRRVIAGDRFTPSSNVSPKASCSPVASRVLSSDISCLPCHANNNMVADDHIYYDGADVGTGCISCHVEQDESGRPTHYYNWRYDPPGKRLNPRLAAFYEPLDVKLRNGSVFVRWRNDHLPHRLGDCPEMVLRFTVRDSLGSEEGSALLRVNRMGQHVAHMLNHFNGNSFPGEEGISPIPGSTDTVLEIRLSKFSSGEGMVLNVEGLNKPHYWGHDSIASARHRLSIPIE